MTGEPRSGGPGRGGGRKTENRKLVTARCGTIGQELSDLNGISVSVSLYRRSDLIESMFALLKSA